MIINSFSPIIEFITDHLSLAYSKWDFGRTKEKISWTKVLTKWICLQTKEGDWLLVYWFKSIKKLLKFDNKNKNTSHVSIDSKDNKILDHKHVNFDYSVFLSLYAGPQYLIYYKCANTNIGVFITIIFGPALPILYVITSWAIFCQYFFERITLAYLYRRPPTFNVELTLLNIRLMQFATIPSLLLTYWLYGNNQMFDNKIDPIRVQDEMRLSHHTFQEGFYIG